VAGELVLWKITLADGNGTIVGKKPVCSEAPADHEGAIVRQIFWDQSIRGGNFQVFTIPSQLCIYDQKLNLIGSHTLHHRHFLCAALHARRAEMCMAFADGSMKVPRRPPPTTLSRDAIPPQVAACQSSQVWDGIGLGSRFRRDKDDIVLKAEWRVEKPKPQRQQLHRDGEQGAAWVGSLFADEERDRCLGCCGTDVLIWRWQTGALLAVLPRLHPQPISACCLTADAQLVTCSRDHLVKVPQCCAG
jgi:hypothetical protein